MNKTNFDKIEFTPDKSLTKKIDSDIIGYGFVYGYTFYQKGNLNITPGVKLGSSIMSTGEAYIHFKNKLILGGGVTIAKTVSRINFFISPSYTLFLFKETNKITYGINRNYNGSVSVLSLAAGLRIPL